MAIVLQLLQCGGSHKCTCAIALCCNALQYSPVVLYCWKCQLPTSPLVALRYSGHDRPELKESATQVLSALKNISSIIAHYTQKINSWMSAHKGTPMSSDQVCSPQLTHHMHISVASTCQSTVLPHHACVPCDVIRCTLRDVIVEALATTSFSISTFFSSPSPLPPHSFSSTKS